MIDPGPLPVPLPVLRPDMSFDEACLTTLEFLTATVPMGYWSVSRRIDGQQLYLQVVDGAYGKVAGDSHPWSDSFCQHMVEGTAPQIAPDAMAVPLYAAAGVAKALQIGSYIGIPIETEDGQVFGTLCGLDPAVKTTDLYAEAPALQTIGQLLGRYLDADLARTSAEREREHLLARRAAGALTERASRLVAEPFWQATLAREEPRLRRLGELASVVAVAVDPSLAATATAVIARNTRASDVVAALEAGGFAILARDIKPLDSPGLVARVRTAMVGAGIEAAIDHRDVTIRNGLTGAWEGLAGGWREIAAADRG